MLDLSEVGASADNRPILHYTIPNMVFWERKTRPGKRNRLLLFLAADRRYATMQDIKDKLHLWCHIEKE
jgi:hypothetical protein